MAVNKKKVLLIRLDKIGDLICTLPVDQILDPAAYEVTWVVQKGMGSIVDFGVKSRKYLELDKSKKGLSSGIFKRFLKDNQFDIVISFQSPWWINFLLYMSGIPKRIGPLSKWHSFMFLNHGLNQSRSSSTQHEFDYNLDLVKKLTGPISEKSENIVFQFRKPSSSRWIEQFDLGPRYVVVHPGMMGSALNWKQHQYSKKIQELVDEHYIVAITGTQSDDSYLTQIRRQWAEHPQIRWLQGRLDFERLLEVIYYSEKVIAPSTGVAHIAASLGKSLDAIYSPIRVHHPKRWGPRGITPANSDQVRIHLPNIKCPAQHKCLNRLCIHFNCMDKVRF
jgi:ADP-heptose:LPS heptosyltransferase